MRYILTENSASRSWLKEVHGDRKTTFKNLGTLSGTRNAIKQYVLEMNAYFSFLALFTK